MTTIIIDRRLNPRDKNASNRQRFIERNKAQIKESIKKIIDKTKMSDIEKSNKGIRVRGTGEPRFVADPKTGDKKYTLPGNREYVVGDTQRKPDEDGGGRGSKAGTGHGEEDDFEFLLTYEEYLDFIFDDLELPDLVKKQLKQTKVFQMARSGFKVAGNPAQLDIVRSLKNSMGRRIGLQRPSKEYIEQLEAQLAFDRERGVSKETLDYLEEEINRLKQKQLAVPWIDPIDVRYRNYVPVPKPITKAVMFCVMDVSASMSEREKEIAKRFYLLLNLFLKTKYEQVDLVFVSHTSIAREVTEDEFFYSTETGGTLVSSALELSLKIMKERYNPSDWNIYVAQSSDGDNMSYDNEVCQDYLRSILNLAQYYAYIEVKPDIPLNGNHYNPGPSSLWEAYEEISLSNKKLQMSYVRNSSEVWTVFRGLFSKEKSS